MEQAFGRADFTRERKGGWRPNRLSRYLSVQYCFADLAIARQPNPATWLPTTLRARMLANDDTNGFHSNSPPTSHIYFAFAFAVVVKVIAVSAWMMASSFPVAAAT